MVHLLLKKSAYMLFALLALIIMLTTGCSTLQAIIPQKKEVSNRVYIQPLMNYYQNSAVLVFEFQAPDYAPEAGYAAADILFQTLLRNNTFGKIDFVPMTGGLTIEDQLKMARTRGADFIIIGRVKYVFEGRIYLNSRVDQEIRIISSNSNTTHWHAEMSSSGKTRPETNYVLIKRKEVKGPSLKELMAENAVKFVEMIRQGSPEIKNMSEESILLDAGYHYLLEKKYDQAALYYKQVLAINPDNALAHFNMGVIYEQRGETIPAMKAYQKVISLNSDIIIEESNDSGKIGTTLTDWARKNLERLDKKRQ